MHGNQTNNSDTELLLTRARQGDGDALGQMIDGFRSYLALLARMQLRRYLQAKFDDSDLVQETCLEAQKSFAQFQGSSEAEFMSWLRTILAHTTAITIRHYSRQKRDVRLERQLEQDLDHSSVQLGAAFASPESSPSQRVARRERSLILADALGQLKDDYREVVILHHLEGLSIDEISTQLGRTTDSVQKLWARAIVQLRRVLDGEAL